MFDEIDELQNQINDLRAEILEIKASIQNISLDAFSLNRHNNFTGAMLRNFGQTAGKMFFGSENTMMKSLMNNFNNLANHYSKLNPKNTFAFIGQRFAGGQVSPAGSYLVGERGPEVFTPQQIGKITNSNHDHRNIYINLSITTPDIQNFYKSKNKITDSILKNLT
jgi:hypothetical protein